MSEEPNPYTAHLGRPVTTTIHCPGGNTYEVDEQSPFADATYTTTPQGHSYGGDVVVSIPVKDILYLATRYIRGDHNQDDAKLTEEIAGDETVYRHDGTYENSVRFTHVTGDTNHASPGGAVQVDMPWADIIKLAAEYVRNEKREMLAEAEPEELLGLIPPGF